MSLDEYKMNNQLICRIDDVETDLNMYQYIVDIGVKLNSIVNDSLIPWHFIQRKQKWAKY